MARQNTRLESEGAEFLVLAHLLIEGIAAYKTYTNMQGYDLVATNPDKSTSARISVKSRWRSKPDGFIINNFECDFVVVVKLNRGSKKGNATATSPEFFVFPVAHVISLPRSKGFKKILFSNIPKLIDYQDKWGFIREYLSDPNC